ncbi:MAG: PSD1 and planctomycete cytochrome C domain-containing protein [Aureliella sp.]
MKRSSAFLTLLILMSMTGMPSVQAQEDDQSPEAAEQRHFTLKVLPLLTEKCLGCHGADEDDLKGEFDVRSLEALLKGGESEEPGLVPGNANDSPIYQAVTWEGLEMPPKENDRLTEEQCEMVRRWIEAGAPWPNEDTQNAIRMAEREVKVNDEGTLVSTSGGLSDSWTYRRYRQESIWAFLPIRKEHEFDSVDDYIETKLADAGIEAAPMASPRELIRRAFYDLTGLPPQPEDVKNFLAAWEKDSQAAWNNLIDSLLASEHYGERWAQHWLDVARYADTGGFSNDYERSNAWRYRDYVIRTFNNDKPINQFISEQIAGDEIDPSNPEAIVATSFLRMGPWGTAMIPKEEARQLYLDDVVHSFGQTFLSMPLRCCKCHDHKFDPIPTQDYYRIYSAFATTQPAEVEAAFLPEENLNGIKEGEEFVNEMHRFADSKRKELVNKREAAAKAWYEEHDLPYKDNNARKNDPEDKKPMRHVGLTEMEQGRLKVREQDEWIWNRRKERYLPMVQGVYNGPDRSMNARKLRPPKGKYDQEWVPESVIYTGGDRSAPGQPVTPGVLSACGLPSPTGTKEDPYALPKTQSGRRKALAEWVASDENPLTARSFVNRMWQHHFGKGIVKTANNFGVKGDAPSHPQLLDYLTAKFLENNWKPKSIHKLIMMSAAYRRSTRHPAMEQLANVDPDNMLLARFEPRRLTAEEFRDSMLAASGELNREIGGFPIMPEINMEVALQPRMIQFSIAPAHQPSRTPQERNRRSIYAYRVRGMADPFLEVMNQPNPNDSCEIRDAAAVSPQAFTLFNSDVMVDRAIGLAIRCESEAEEIETQISNAFWLALGRAPESNELNRLTNYFKEMLEYHHDVEPELPTYPTEITRSLVEEFTGKPFEYTERLPVFENYVADPKPATVGPRTRAMADVCLLLFNSNEFAYIY